MAPKKPGSATPKPKKIPPVGAKAFIPVQSSPQGGDDPPKPTNPESPSQETDDVSKSLDIAETEVKRASENGLFTTDNTYENEIDKALSEAKEAIKKKDTVEADASIYKAGRLLDQAWNKTDFWWRFVNEYGGIHHLFTVIGILLVMILYGYTSDCWPDAINKNAFLFGMMGAVVRCFYWIVRAARKV